MKSHRQSANRISGIDGLRGIAILLILLRHWPIEIYAQVINSIHPTLLNVLLLFAYGVDVFFVISGFLIGRILLKTKENGFQFKTFYFRRVLRILPLFYLITIPLFIHFYRNGLTDSLPPFWSYIFFLFNHYDALNIAPVHLFIAPFWSLAIEEQFYVFAPLVFCFLPLRAIKFICLIGLFSQPLIRACIHFTGIEYDYMVSTFTRSDGILFGVALAIACNEPRFVDFLKARIMHLKYALAFILFALLGGRMVQSEVAPLFEISLVCTIASIMIVLILYDKKTDDFLSIPFLIYSGQRCFFLYLSHNLILYLLVPQLIDLGIIFVWQILLVAGFVLYGLSHLSWNYFEYPLIKLSHKMSYLKKP